MNLVQLRLDSSEVGGEMLCACVELAPSAPAGAVVGTVVEMIVGAIVGAPVGDVVAITLQVHNGSWGGQPSLGRGET